MNYDEERKEVADAVSTHERFQLVKKHSKLQTTTADSKSKSWVLRIKRNYIKMESCVKECHGGSEQSFLAAASTLNISNYKCQCNK